MALRIKNMGKANGKQISDYVWLDKTQRSWHVWAGNPFIISLFIIPLKEITEKEIIKKAKSNNAKAKKSFVKAFPDVKWVLMTK